MGALRGFSRDNFDIFQGLDEMPVHPKLPLTTENIHLIPANRYAIGTILYDKTTCRHYRNVDNIWIDLDNCDNDTTTKVTLSKGMSVIDGLTIVSRNPEDIVDLNFDVNSTYKAKNLDSSKITEISTDGLLDINNHKKKSVSCDSQKTFYKKIDKKTNSCKTLSKKEKERIVQRAYRDFQENDKKTGVSIETVLWVLGGITIAGLSISLLFI